MRKSKQLIVKSRKTNAEVEMLINMNFWSKKMFYQRNDLLKKAPTIKRVEYSPSGSELQTNKKQ